MNRRRIILGALFAVAVGAPCSAPAALAEQADEPKFNFRLSAVPFDVTGKLRLAGAGEGRLERPPPVRIVGCRNGSFSGLVVVSSPEPLRGLAAEVSDLARRQAGGTLPKGCVRVRWAILDGAGGFFDTLDDTPPEKIEMDPKTGALVRPMWITVTVPGDAGPGEYAGRVTVSAEGLGQTEVRLQLKVIDWTLPEPKDFASHVGIVQSPDSVAAMYRVAMWSEEHWKLLEKTFEPLGQIGADDVYIPLIRRTHFGNEHSMVRWIAQPSGGYRHDFSVAERYLDLAVKHLGTPPVVCLYLWEINTGSIRYSGVGRQAITPVPITLLDPATGKLTEGEGPKWGQTQSKAFWKPVIDGMRQRLAKRGLADSMMFGLATDALPLQETVDDLRAVAPEVTWVVHNHSGTRKLYGQPVGYGAYVWAARHVREKHLKEPVYGWKQPFIFATFPRWGGGAIGPLKPMSPFVSHRYSIEAHLVAGHSGFGRMGADFWPVSGGRRKSNLLNRYPISGMTVPISDATAALLGHGASGPVPTVRFELLREGVQEAEARVLIEKALTDPAAKAKLGPEFAGRAQALLLERVRALLSYRVASQDGSGERWNKVLSIPDWQKSSEKLYALAGQVAAKLANPAASPD